jgi:uncharacterized repeat protein (TIGR03803 family)
MTWRRYLSISVLGLMFVLAVLGTPPAQTQTYTVLHTFTGPDGATPEAGLIADPAGNLYGTTSFGGESNNGTVFKLSDNGLTGLCSFAAGPNRGQPQAGLMRDPAGSLYGTAKFGNAGGGTVFKLDAAGAYTVLHDFPGKGADGRFPLAGLIRDSAGNLYGTTAAGGVSSDGTVFKLDKTGETVLYSFTGGADGRHPRAGVIQDSAGNLYGTTVLGGRAGVGEVFKLDAAGTYARLYSFRDGAGGSEPAAALIQDSAGNLYGTAAGGGASYAGVVFKMDAAGTETTLYTFTGGTDGGNPEAVLVPDSAGNLYGTTCNGGQGTGNLGFGVVFRLDTAGTETVLYAFTGGVDGAHPLAGLFRDPAGNLYGTTSAGGIKNSTCPSGCGVVFKIAP